VPEIVIVPDVFIVKLFAIPAEAVALQVPVPLRTKFVVPVKDPVAVKEPPMFIVFPFNTLVVEFKVTLPETVQVSARVQVPESKIKSPVKVLPAEVIVAVLLNCRVPVPAIVIPATNVTVVVTVSF
jgi:hypothetical protein